MKKPLPNPPQLARNREHSVKNSSKIMCAIILNLNPVKYTIPIGLFLIGIDKSINI